MFILSDKQIYPIKFKRDVLNKDLDKLMAAEQLDIKAISDELKKHPKNGTNPYIIWDRFMYECAKIGCINIETEIHTPRLFLKNGRELETDVVANMSYTSTGWEEGCFESRYYFWLGKLSLRMRSFGFGFETNHDCDEGYTKCVCGKTLGTDCDYRVSNTSHIMYFMQNFWKYVACVEDAVKNENRRLIKAAADAYST